MSCSAVLQTSAYRLDILAMNTVRRAVAIRRRINLFVLVAVGEHEVAVSEHVTRITAVAVDEDRRDLPRMTT